MAIQKWSDDVLVARAADDPELSEDFAEINDRLGGRCCDIVLDLADLTLLTSSGISKLLRLRKRQVEAHRRLVLCTPKDRVWGVLLATGLDTIFEVAPTVTEALARLEGGKA
jgi:anti-anti-sigma factor